MLPWLTSKVIIIIKIQPRQQQHPPKRQYPPTSRFVCLSSTALFFLLCMSPLMVIVQPEDVFKQQPGRESLKNRNVIIEAYRRFYLSLRSFDCGWCDQRFLTAQKRHPPPPPELERKREFRRRSKFKTAIKSNSIDVNFNKSYFVDLLNPKKKYGITSSNPIRPTFLGWIPTGLEDEFHIDKHTHTHTHCDCIRDSAVGNCGQVKHACLSLWTFVLMTYLFVPSCHCTHTHTRK
jgi:hypothetical protein